MNLPNKLSVLRVILTFVMIIPTMFNIPGFNETFLGIQYSVWFFVIVFVIGSLTDFLDGYIARKYNLVTDFGKFIDPLADKIFVISAFCILQLWGKIPVLFTVIVITREFAVSGYRMLEAESGKVVAASFAGKLKTALSMIAVIAMALTPYPFWTFTFPQGTSVFQIVFSAFAQITMLGCIIATIVSGWDYLKNLKYVIKTK